MDPSFDRLLADLGDEAQPLPIQHLSQISDLDAQRLKRLQAAWRNLSVERRRSLVTQLGTLADQHIELTFERVNRFALGDEDAEVRRAAIRNLWECEDPGLAPQLLEALRHDLSVSVRTAAAAALGQFIYLGEVDEMEAGLLRQVEEGLLRSVNHDPDSGVRKRSLESLGYSSRAEVPALIEAAFASPDEEQRLAALVAMGRSANEGWQPQVLASLHSPAPSLRSEAARAAGELELREALPDLIELTEDVDAAVRKAAIWSLAQLGGDAAAEVLTRLLKTTEDKDESALLEDALDYLAFVDGTRGFALFDVEGDQDPSH